MQKSKGCAYYFVKLDEEILRPLLIYKYDEEEMWYQDEQVELMQSDVNFIGSIYGKMDHN